MKSPAPVRYGNKLQIFGMSDWIGFMIVFSIPVIGFAMALYWGVLKKTVDANQRSFSRAMLFFLSLGYVIYFVEMLSNPYIR